MVKVIRAGRYVEVKNLHYLELERRIRGQSGRHTKSRYPAVVRPGAPPAKVRPRPQLAAERAKLAALKAPLTLERAKLAALLAPLGDGSSISLN